MAIKIKLRQCALVLLRKYSRIEATYCRLTPCPEKPLEYPHKPYSPCLDFWKKMDAFRVLDSGGYTAQRIRFWMTGFMLSDRTCGQYLINKLENV